MKNSGAISVIAGDDSSAKETVSALIREIGLTPIDAGLSYNARQLESFGDMVRPLMIKNQLGSNLVFSTQMLPSLENFRLGERQ